MGVPAFVHVVQCGQQLPKERTCDLLAESTSLGYEVKELSPRRVLQDHSTAHPRRLSLPPHDRRLPHRQQLQQVLMGQILHDLQFGLEGDHGGGLLLELLDGDGTAVGVEGQFHPAWEGSYYAEKPEPMVLTILNSSSHSLGSLDTLSI
jgi:hypothetical protein